MSVAVNSKSRLLAPPPNDPIAAEITYTRTAVLEMTEEEYDAFWMHLGKANRIAAIALRRIEERALARGVVGVSSDTPGEGT